MPPLSTPLSSISLGHTSTPPNNGTSGHQMMLQKQQAMLQEVLNGQKVLQNTVESHLAELQSKVEESATCSSSSEGKRKRIVTQALSVSLF